MQTSKLLKIAALTLTLWAGNAFAAYTTYLYESGGNVVASGSGTFNLAGLAFFGNGGGAVQIVPSQATLIFGTNTFALAAYTGYVGPANFGLGGSTAASSSSGNGTIIAPAANFLFVPAAYVSGTPLSASATWNGTTLAALGATPGTYTWTWGAGPTADSYTLIIGSAPPSVGVQSVPTLSEYGLAILALLFAGIGMRSVRRRQA